MSPTFYSTEGRGLREDHDSRFVFLTVFPGGHPACVVQPVLCAPPFLSSLQGTCWEDTLSRGSMWKLVLLYMLSKQTVGQKQGTLRSNDITILAEIRGCEEWRPNNGKLRGSGDKIKPSSLNAPSYFYPLVQALVLRSAEAWMRKFTQEKQLPHWGLIPALFNLGKSLQALPPTIALSLLVFIWLFISAFIKKSNIHISLQNNE